MPYVPRLKDGVIGTVATQGEDAQRSPQNRLLKEVYDILEGHAPVAARLEELRAKHPFTEEDLHFFVFAYNRGFGITIEQLPEFAKLLEIGRERPKRQSNGTLDDECTRPFWRGLSLEEILARLPGRQDPGDAAIEAALQEWISIQVVVQIGDRYAMTDCSQTGRPMRNAVLLAEPK